MAAEAEPLADELGQPIYGEAISPVRRHSNLRRGERRLMLVASSISGVLGLWRLSNSLAGMSELTSLVSDSVAGV
jgi:hypothetical protein